MNLTQRIERDKVASGVPFTLSGKLEYEKAAGSWVGLANAPVKIYVGATLVSTLTTDAAGNFSTTLTLTESQTVKAVFEGMYIPAALIFFAPSETQDLLPLLGALAPIFAVGGAIAYDSLTKRS